jgi:hypothetical protein
MVVFVTIEPSRYHRLHQYVLADVRTLEVPRTTLLADDDKLEIDNTFFYDYECLFI